MYADEVDDADVDADANAQSDYDCRAIWHNLLSSPLHLQRLSRSPGQNLLILCISQGLKHDTSISTHIEAATL